MKQSKRLTFNSQFQIGNTTISEQEKTFIIAEAGVNHNGNMSLAKEMIDVASESGADAVKFQTFKAEKLILKNIEKDPYQKDTTNSN